MRAHPVIDVHAHILEEETIERMRREAPQMELRISGMDADGARLEMAGAQPWRFPRGAWDLDVRLKAMEQGGVDVQVLSIVPYAFFYDLEPSLGAAFAALQNDQIAARVRAMPDRFLGIATLPMQAPERAAEELRRAMGELGLKGAMIGTQVCGRNLDDPDLEPVWAAASELKAFLFIHPHKISGERLKSYYLTNLIGNPLDTTIAAASLVFGGVMERYPDLRILLAHGGGFTPYQAGRLVHGWHVRKEPKKHLQTAPDESLSRFYYDTLTHSRPTLKSLVEWVGASQVLLGTDFPFDMGEFDCAENVKAIGLSPEDETMILSGRAGELLSTR